VAGANNDEVSGRSPKEVEHTGRSEKEGMRCTYSLKEGERTGRSEKEGTRYGRAANDEEEVKVVIPDAPEAREGANGEEKEGVRCGSACSEESEEVEVKEEAVVFVEVNGEAETEEGVSRGALDSALSWLKSVRCADCSAPCICPGGRGRGTEMYCGESWCACSWAGCCCCCCWGWGLSGEWNGSVCV
jgi:hypothetical protein